MPQSAAISIDPPRQDPSAAPEVHVDLSRCRSEHSFKNKLGRVAWHLAWTFLFRPSPRVLHRWRCVLLRLFGARIAPGVKVDPRCRIWAPWNLTMGAHSCLGPEVDCYCVAPIRIGPHAMVSQYSYLCAATHDYEDPTLPLVASPIVIGQGAWITADVFVGPGVTVGEGAVVGARSVVIKDVAPWTVVAGHPARFLKHRVLNPS